MGRDARDQACQSNKLIQIDVLLVCAENNRTCIYHDYAFIGRIRIETAGQSRLPDQRTMNANMLFRSLLLTVLNFDFYKFELFCSFYWKPKNDLWFTFMCFLFQKYFFMVCTTHTLEYCVYISYIGAVVVSILARVYN